MLHVRPAKEKDEEITCSFLAPNTRKGPDSGFRVLVHGKLCRPAVAPISYHFDCLDFTAPLTPSLQVAGGVLVLSTAGTAGVWVEAQIVPSILLK